MFNYFPYQRQIEFYEDIESTLKGQTLKNAVFDDLTDSHNYHYEIFKKYLTSKGQNKMYPDYSDIRQHPIYTQGCTATRTMWCDKQGNYHAPKDMDTSYLRNVVKLLRTVAEAKIFDAKRVINSPLTRLKASQYHTDVSKMSVDTYCFNNFIIWDAIKAQLAYRCEWKPNFNQSVNLPVMPEPTWLGFDRATSKSTEVPTITLPFTEVSKKIDNIETRISNLGQQSANHYTADAAIVRTQEQHTNRMNSLSNRLDTIAETITIINRNCEQLILDNAIQKSRKKVVKKRKR